MKNILIADDNKQILDVLKEYAVREGFQVYTAETGKEALEKFGGREYEAVLLDVMMPEIDGFEVCRRIPFRAIYESDPQNRRYGQAAGRGKLYSQDRNTG